MTLWIWRIILTAVCITLTLLYYRGRQIVPSEGKLRPLAFHAGLIILLLALASPLHYLAGQYFSMRVAQHLLLIAWAPALLLAANPVPQLLAGLPAGWRKWLKEKLSFFRHFSLLAARGTAWILFVSTFWLWYDPTLHQATLLYPPLRYLEVSLLFGAALLYWWHITAAYPHIHKPMAPIARAAYTLVGAWPIKMVGLILMFNPGTVYLYPQTFQFSGLSITDYNIGSIIIWVLGGIVFTTTTTVLMRDWLKGEEDKPSLPVSTWSSEEVLAAPGYRK
ncbi:MAG: cytochrome c oxidase assembly protein [Chloroflexota bacterium]